LKLQVITPVGPGHEPYVRQCAHSVGNAKPGPFTVEHVFVDDSQGELGRSRARNIGMGEADWYFFLDADDTLRPDALHHNDFNAAATFGAVSLSGTVAAENVYPCGWREIARHGALGTLSMGFFCRSDVARALRFKEDLDAGEDFEFYLRLPSFTKLERPLVDIGYHRASASGPRGYDSLQWTTVCDRVIDDYGRDALLEKAGRAGSQPAVHAGLL
jgi:hypothetical protein